MANFVSIYVDDIEGYQALGDASFIEGVYDISGTLKGQSYVNQEHISLIMLDGHDSVEMSIFMIVNEKEINLLFGSDEEDEYSRMLAELGLIDDAESYEKEDDFEDDGEEDDLDDYDDLYEDDDDF